MAEPPAPPVLIAPEPPPQVQVQSRVLGKTVDGRPMTLHLFGDPVASAGKTVLILGGIHGNEPTSAGVCRELLAYLTKNAHDLNGKCIALVPEANPDGLARKLRTNSNLVDLNRNFPASNWKKTRKSSFFGGDAAASQPETKVLMALIDELKPSRIVSIHSMDDPCNNYDGPGEALARAMAACNGYPVKASIGYPTPGSFGSWAGGDRGIPVITLELPNRTSTAKSWAANREALLTVIQTDASSVARSRTSAVPPNAGSEAVNALGK